MPDFLINYATKDNRTVVIYRYILWNCWNINKNEIICIILLELSIIMFMKQNIFDCTYALFSIKKDVRNKMFLFICVDIYLL